jgi:osmoprotectant transport system permease protein
VSLALALPFDPFVEFATENQDRLARMFVEHVVLVAQTLLLALPLGVALGVFITLYERASTPVLWFAGVLLTIPSIALFGVLVPVLGIGAPPVIAALVAYSLLPIVRNTYVGLSRADEATVEAGQGLGMTRWQRLRRLRLPVALPVVMAGVRNATVIVVGLAAIGAFIGGPGLGHFIFNGISDGNTAMIVVTTVVLSGLALAFDYGLAVVEELLRMRNGETVEPTLATKTLRLLRPL